MTEPHLCATPTATSGPGGIPDRDPPRVFAIRGGAALSVAFALVAAALHVLAPDAQAQQVRLYANGRLAAVQNSRGEVHPRYTGLATVGRGDLSAGVFHITSGSFSVTELSSALNVHSSAVAVSPGLVLAHNHVGTTMVGPNLSLALTAPQGRIGIPVARYLHAVDGESGQWSIVVDGSAGRWRATGQSFGPSWEFQAGAALFRIVGITPELRVLQNRNGPGVELRGIWTN